MKQASLDRRAKEQLLPTSVGEGVPSLTGEGKVVSSFSRAVNIRHSLGLIVSLVEDPRAMTYLSVCIPALFQKQEKRLVPEDRVRFEGHRLVTEDLVVDFLGKPTWQGTLTRMDVKGFCGEKVSLVQEALLLKGKEGGFLGLLRGEASSNPFVSKAREVLDVRFKILSGMTGLGPGSTPSGDDFLAGVLLGEEVLKLLLPAKAKAVAGSQDTMIPWPIEKEDLRLSVDRTNDAGKTLLWQALQGRFPAYLIEAVRSVSAAQERQEIEAAVEKAAGCGATSGTDALVGFVHYLERGLHDRSRPSSISES